MHSALSFFFFFFNDTATTEIYTLSLHDALPISSALCGETAWWVTRWSRTWSVAIVISFSVTDRSEEHTSELQSQSNLVCRLLLEKKKKKKKKIAITEQSKTSRDVRKGTCTCALA